MCFMLFKLPNLASLASFILSGYRNKVGMNLIVKAINNAIVLGFILNNFNGFKSFSIAVTISVRVVVNAKIDAIDMNKINLQIVNIPWSNLFLEKNTYIIKMNKNMKKKGLKFLNKDEKFNFDKIIINKMKIVNIANL